MHVSELRLNGPKRRQRQGRNSGVVEVDRALSDWKEGAEFGSHDSDFLARRRNGATKPGSFATWRCAVAPPREKSLYGA